MTITLEAIETKQAELNALIAQFQNTQKTTTLKIPETVLELKTGERYAGLVINDKGEPMHHLILMPDWAGNVTWTEARDWAKKVSGELPMRKELFWIFVNCKPHLQRHVHWSCEEYEYDASCAWDFSFTDGNQIYSHKGEELCAVAVRRVTV